MASKYNQADLLAALRIAVMARVAMLSIDSITDSVGAIHSVERVLDALSMLVKYPNISTGDLAVHCPSLERSVEAQRAIESRHRVEVEHVAPKREYSIGVCNIIAAGATNNDILAYIQRHYRLVLLTPQERRSMSRKNRSRLTTDRLADAGIQVYTPRSTPRQLTTH